MTCCSVHSFATTRFIYKSHKLFAICFAEVKSVEVKLAQRHDSGFFTFRELHHFFRKLCHRSLLPKHVHGLLYWKALHDLQDQELRQLSSCDFHLRLKLKTYLDGDCRTRVQKENNERDSQTTKLETLVGGVTEAVVIKAGKISVFSCRPSC